MPVTVSSYSTVTCDCRGLTAVNRRRCITVSKGLRRDLVVTIYTTSDSTMFRWRIRWVRLVSSMNIRNSYIRMTDNRKDASGGLHNPARVSSSGGQHVYLCLEVSNKSKFVRKIGQGEYRALGMYTSCPQ